MDTTLTLKRTSAGVFDGTPRGATAEPPVASGVVEPGEGLVRGYGATFAIDSGSQARYFLHNRTPHRIRIIDETYGDIELPPLAQRVMRGARLAPFQPGLRSLRQHHQIRVREYHKPSCATRVVAASMWLAAAVLAVVVVYDVLTVGTLERREVGVAAAVTAGLVLLELALGSTIEWFRRRREEIADAEEGDIEFGMGGSFYDGNETLRRTKLVATLLTVITIGAVLPAVAIFVATDAKDFLVMRGGLHVVDGTESQLVARAIQVVYTAVLSLFPALLYFQFDRHRVGTIRSEWVRSIFRMDERMETLADVNARYGDELAEASGYSADSVRLLGGRHSPIVVATLLITLGWISLVAQTAAFDFTVPTAEQGYFELLVPTPSAAAMAFLGGYFFGTYLILRSYFRGDLRPKIYSQISARLITVVVLAYLIQALFSEFENRYIWTLSFLAGVVPTTVLQRIGHILSSVVAAAAGPSHETDPSRAERRWIGGAFEKAFATPRALSQLDGVDLHDSTRLETEGINDVPSLAKADLVSLMVSTRLPVDRLVDWVDQAVLVMLLDDGTNDDLDERVTQLRTIGLRTASSVLAANAGGPESALYKSANRILSPQPDTEIGISLPALAEEIGREPAMRRILQWIWSSLGSVNAPCQILQILNEEGARATVVTLDQCRMPANHPTTHETESRMNNDNALAQEPVSTNAVSPDFDGEVEADAPKEED